VTITSVLYGTLLQNHLAYFMHPESVCILGKRNCDLFCAGASYFMCFTLSTDYSDVRDGLIGPSE
jgi:hypothetical protein